MLIASLVFSLACGVIVWLHFAFALREWRRTRGAPTLAIDMGYTRSEGHLPASFRTKLAEWMQAEARPAEDGQGHVIERRGERIRILPTATLPDLFRSDGVLVVLGDLTCGERCTFGREVYVQGNCTIGAGSVVQAIAVDGDLVLGRTTGVVRWADAEGDVTVGADCRIGARVTARRSIRIAAGARARAFSAPEVRTLSSGTEPPLQPGSRRPAVRVPPVDDTPAAGAWPHRFDRLTDACWRYGGSLTSDRPLDVGRTLIVRGDVHAPAGSRFASDIKATGSIAIGPGSECLAGVVSDRSILVGPGTVLGGHLLAGDCAVIDRGVRGANTDTGVAAYAHRVLYVRDAVVIAGKLAAGDYVQVLDAREPAAVKGLEAR